MTIRARPRKRTRLPVFDLGFLFSLVTFLSNSPVPDQPHRSNTCGVILFLYGLSTALDCLMDWSISRKPRSRFRRAPTKSGLIRSASEKCRMASPKFFLNFRELFKNLAARYAFDYPYYFRYRISWWKRNQYVNVIFRYFASIYLKIKMTRYLKKKLLYSWLNSFIKCLFSVFRAPNQMIFGFINRMARSFHIHAAILI